MFLDGTFLSIRRGQSGKEPVYIALRIKPDGRREILGFWPFGAEGESAKDWEEVLKDLWRRGIRRVRIFITDDLPGLEEAIRKIFPEADWQLCVLHAVRNTFYKVRRTDRKALAQDLKAMYGAEIEEEAKKKHAANCENGGERFILGLSSTGKTGPMRSWRSCAIRSPSVGTSTPPSSFGA